MRFGCPDPPDPPAPITRVKSSVVLNFTDATGRLFVFESCEVQTAMRISPAATAREAAVLSPPEPR